MWNRIFLTVLHRAIRAGRLNVTLADGTTHQIGPDIGTPVAVTLSDPALPRKILLNPELAIGEAYMAGTLTVAGDDLSGFIALLIQSAVRGDLPPALQLLRQMRKGRKRRAQFNPAAKSLKNVAHHYELSDKFYRLFLEEDMQYTCAYYREPGMTLEAAQAAKIDHIAAKLLIRPGMRVLDIGCGWGGLAIRLAQKTGAHVTGITLSPAQLETARARAAGLGLAGQVEFRLQDYRDLPDTFDRVVSVGMMEHVGQPQYGAYFSSVANSLAPDGVALIHFIGRSSGPNALSPWFQKYIFPGGYAPAFSEVMPPVETSGLVMTDLEVWRGHYAQTLLHWRERFEANLPEICGMYDARFVRMWRFYLVSAEMSFRGMHQVLFQMQLAKTPLAVPGTRDYLYP